MDSKKAMINKYLKTDFFKNISVLMGGTIIAQAIPILLSPLMSRIYTKADFALYNLFFGAIAIFFIFFTLRYEQAIVLPKDRREAQHLVVLTSLISLFVGAMSTILCYFIASPVSILLGNPAFEKWIFLLPPTLTFIGIYQGFNYYLTREKRFTASSINRISQRIVESIVNIVFGLLRVPAGQLWGDFSGRVAVSIMSSSQSANAGFSFKDIDFSLVKSLAKRYYQFAVIGSIPAVLNALSSNLSLFFISAFYLNVNDTADFGNSRTILAVPLSIISVNLSQLLLQRLSAKKNNQQDIYPEVKKVFISLLAISILIWLVLQFFAPSVFAFIYSESWRSTGEVTAILACGFAFRFAVSPLSCVFTVYEEVKMLSAWQVFYFLSIASLYFFKHLEFHQFLWLYTAIDMFAYTIYLILIFYVIKRHKKNPKLQA
jgi:O-antigen/teichoic acid export membrane protein